MIFWDEREPTKQSNMSAKFVTAKQRVRDAHAGWAIRQRGTVPCYECGSMRGKDGEPRWAKWAYMGRPYCTVCVPHRVMPKEPVTFYPDENYRACALCGGRFRIVGEKDKRKYCNRECNNRAYKQRGYGRVAARGVPDGTRSTESETQAIQ